MDTDTLTVDAEEAALRELGQQTDAAEGRPISEAPSAETPEPRAAGQEEQVEQQQPQPPETGEPEQKPVSSETEPKPEQPRDPVTQRFQKAETEYTRAQKEAERKERSWQALQAEKENFRRMVTQEQERQRIQQLEAARASFAPLQKDGLTAAQYYQGYQRFKQEGDFQNAAAALEVALELQNGEQARIGQVQAVNAEYAWRMGMNEAIQANPAVGDPDSPVAAHIERIIAQNPWIYHVPQGFQRAAEVADMLVKMDSISELQDENENLRAQLEKYQRKSQPGKGGYAAPRLGEKDFDEMTLDEQEAELNRMTREADNYR
jgi:hypothetical protein